MGNPDENLVRQMEKFSRRELMEIIKISNEIIKESERKDKEKKDKEKKENLFYKNYKINLPSGTENSVGRHGLLHHPIFKWVASIVAIVLTNVICFLLLYWLISM